MKYNSKTDFLHCHISVQLIQCSDLTTQKWWVKGNVSQVAAKSSPSLTWRKWLGETWWGCWCRRWRGKSVRSPACPWWSCYGSLPGTDWRTTKSPPPLVIRYPRKGWDTRPTRPKSRYPGTQSSWRRYSATWTLVMSSGWRSSAAPGTTWWSSPGQSGALSLVEICRDTVLWLVEIMMLLTPAL